MNKLFFLTTAVFSVISLSACNQYYEELDKVPESGKVTIKTLNSKNDQQICYNPFHCLFMPSNSQIPTLEFMKSPEMQVSTLKESYDNKFSPIVARKVEEIKSMAKQPVTVTSVSRSPASVKAKTDGLDFQVSGVKSETLKQFCKNSGAHNIRIYNSHVHCDWLSQPLSMDMKKEPLDLKVSGDLKKGESVEVSLNALDKDEESELAVEWNVEMAGKQILSAQSSKLTIKDLKPGLYQVKAQVGDGQEENISLIVE